MAGYFLYAKLEKGKNKAVITDYVKRVMKMWLVWLLLYMPIFAYQLLSQGNLLTTCLSFLHKTVCITPAYLWYLSALACGSVLMAVFFLKNEEAYLVASILLFMACIAYGAEVFLVGQSDRIYEDRSFYFTLPLAAGCVAECILNFKVNISWAFACRRLSTWIYLLEFSQIVIKK